MRLTTDILQRFVGGQLEVQNMGEGYLYRGEISSIEVAAANPLPGVDNGGDMKVTLRWMAKMGEGGWEVDSKTDYSASLAIYLASELSDDRIFLNCLFNGETATLFPAGGSVLDPTRVKGLNVTA